MNKDNGDIRWKKNTTSFLVVYSILAAIASVILTTILIADNDYLKKYWFWTAIPLSLSIFLFIYSGEKIVDAMDEDDVEKYLSLLLLYNLGVILFFWGLLATIYLRYVFAGGIHGFSGYRNLGIFILIFWLAAKHWLKHERWLLFTSEKEFREYIDELEERVVPEKEPNWFFCLFMWCRRHFSKNDVPDEFVEVRVDLRPSLIAGVGLFAVKGFKKGEVIAQGISDEDFNNMVSWGAIEGIEPEIRKMIMAFCIGTPEGFVPPEGLDFNQLTPDWYMNHSCDGHVGFDDEGNFVAIRIIDKGEELTYDYGLAESNPDFRLEDCSCGASNCRGTITGNDWLDPAFQEKNIRHMHPRLRKLIRELSGKLRTAKI